MTEAQVQWHSGEVVSVTPSGGGYLIVRVKASAAFRHEAGQFTTFRLRDELGEFERHYSIASPPGDDGIIEFCILAGGDMRAGAIYQSLKPGDKLAMHPARGDFRIVDAMAPSVFIAGGSGISPIRALLMSQLAQTSVVPIRLLFGCRNAENFPFLEEMIDRTTDEAVDFAAWFCAEDKALGHVRLGRVTDYLDEAMLPNAHYYLCGPPGMVDAVVAALETRNVPPARIHFERF